MNILRVRCRSAEEFRSFYNSDHPDGILFCPTTTELANESPVVVEIACKGLPNKVLVRGVVLSWRPALPRLRIILTTTTSTGGALARETLPRVCPEADLLYFGKEKEQKSKITGWIGTKQAVGLHRSDGSLILLGIGREPGRVAQE